MYFITITCTYITFNSVVSSKFEFECCCPDCGKTNAREVIVNRMNVMRHNWEPAEAVKGSQSRVCP